MGHAQRVALAAVSIAAILATCTVNVQGGRIVTPTRRPTRRLLQQVANAGPAPEAEALALLSSGLFADVSHGNVPAIEALFSEGASTDVYSANGSTPLIDAIRERDQRVINALLVHGVNTNLASKPNGVTPLQLALQMGNVALANQLLQAGADINQKDAAGDNALLLAVKQKPVNYNAVSLLLSQRPSPTTSAPDFVARDARGLTAYQIAVQSVRLSLHVTVHKIISKIT